MRVSLLAAIGLAALTTTDIASAQDASLGCKVLLCAASPAPGWPSIPYCVAPMQQVLSMVMQGASWPPCQQAGNAPPQVSIQPFLSCPNGSLAVSIPPGSVTYSADPNGQSCASSQDLTAYMTALANPSSAADNGFLPILNTFQRPVNPNPISVTLDLGGTQSQQTFSVPR